MKTISIEEVEFIAHTLAKETMDWDEPIPAFETRFPNILESCVATPFQRFDGKYLYSSLFKRASILFYLMIKNHPFQNGNKRIAVTTTLCFLIKNHKWLNVDNHELYNFAKWIAASNAKLKDATVNAIESFLKMHVFDVEK